MRQISEFILIIFYFSFYENSKALKYQREREREFIESDGFHIHVYEISRVFENGTFLNSDLDRYPYVMDTNEIVSVKSVFNIFVEHIR